MDSRTRTPDQRTHAGPMDFVWENNRMRVPESSPWVPGNTQKPAQNLFGSPSKFGARPDHAPQTSSKPLPPVPQTSLFNPHIQQSNTAPAFRNPAFHTPRKPFDEAPFSEAESSPGLTEQSDFPDDTPEVDRFADLNMGTITPSKVDKALRYNKAGNHLTRKHAPGRGEIARASRDYPALRKRKRLTGDRDVGSLRMHPPGQESDSDYDYESDVGVHRKGRSGRREKKSWIASTFDLISEHPSMPDHLSRWFTFLVNVTVVSTIGYVGWSMWTTVRDDIETANAQNRQDIVAKANACQHNFDLNGCGSKDRAPALKDVCEEWDACRFQDPQSIMVVRNTAKQMALVINEFASNMEIRSMLLIICILLIFFGLNQWKTSLGPPSMKASTPSMPPPTPAPVHNHTLPPPPTVPYIERYVMPYGTPSHHRQIDVHDDATDTDGASPPIRRALPPPQTPSRRQYSPSKEGRTRSPVKMGRASSRDYY